MDGCHQPISAAPTGTAPRSSTLDAARGVAVVAMVLGHTIDGVLATHLRAHEWVQTYWRLRGITAPLFLVVAGWAICAWVARSGLRGVSLVRARVTRVLLLLSVGYLLHLPGRYLLLGDGDVTEAIRQLTAFDALHCIALALLASTVVMALVETHLLRILALVGLAFLVVVASGPLWRMAPSLPLPLGQLMTRTQGSLFPFFPWASYLFAGVVVGLVVGQSRRRLLQATCLVAGGAALMLFAALFGLKGLHPTSVRMYLYRLGETLVALGGVAFLPLLVARVMAPLGRISLGVYIAHLPLVYGWGSLPGLAPGLGPTLPLGQAVALGLVILTVAVAVAAIARRTRRWYTAAQVPLLTESVGQGWRRLTELWSRRASGAR